MYIKMDETPADVETLDQRRRRAQSESKKRWWRKKDETYRAARNQANREKHAAKNALLPVPPRMGRRPGPSAKGPSRIGYVLDVGPGGMACIIFSTSEIMSARTDGLPPVGAGDIVRVTPGQAPFCRFAGGEHMSAVKEWTAVMDAAYRHQQDGSCPAGFRLALARMFSRPTPGERRCLREAALIRLQEADLNQLLV
jgi:hypothetical protein